MIKILQFLFLFTLGVQAVDDLNEEEVLAFLNAKSSKISNSVFKLVHNGEPIALACAFNNNGYIISSLKEVPKGTMIQNHDGGLFPVEVIGSDRKTHITVLKTTLSTQGLNYSELPVNTGKILGAIDNKGCFAMGIVSLAPYKATQSLFHHSIRFPLDARPKILHVENNSPESKAGLKPGDIINSINGQLLFSGRDALSVLNALKVNEKIEMAVIRQGDIFKTSYVPAKEKFYDELPKRVVFQHDIKLSPNQYGGPLCYSNGKFIGISLNYATPSGTYALKASECARVARNIIRKRNKNLETK